MACEICYPSGKSDDKSDDDGSKEHDHHKHCEHEHDCDCEKPEPPSGLPDCPEDPAGPSEGCIPNEEIARREAALAKAQDDEARLKLDIENRDKALQELKAKSDLLEQALATYHQETEQREQRHKACQEFVGCKEPETPTDDRECVDSTLDAYRDELHRYKKYVPYVSWELGHARIRTAKAERRHTTAEEHYEWVQRQATDCLAKCEELTTKYDEAEAADDQCLMYLYWRSIRDVLAHASEDCLDKDKYGDHLCRAFECLSGAKDNLNEARAEQDRLERELESVQEKYEAWKEDRWAVITAHIDKCCCRPSPVTEEPSPTPQSQSQQSYS